MSKITRIRENINRSHIGMMRTSRRYEDFEIDKIYTDINLWIFLKEKGLITSYPKHNTISHITNICDKNKLISYINIDNEILELYIYNIKDITRNILLELNSAFNLLGRIVADIYLFDKNKKTINDKFIKFDDFINNFEEILINNVSYIGIQLESNFGIELDEIPDKMYHAIKKIYVENILKYGLIPYSDSKKSVHPDRVYLSLDKDTAYREVIKLQMAEHDKFIYKNRNNKDIKYIPDFTYTMLEITVPKYRKYYQDSMYVSNAWYTLSGIDKKYIKVLDDIEFDN